MLWAPHHDHLGLVFFSSTRLCLETCTVYIIVAIPITFLLLVAVTCSSEWLIKDVLGGDYV